MMRPSFLLLLATLGPLEASPQAAPPIEDNVLPICINEFMPANVASLFTEEGENADWIELYNPTKKAISLSGWTLSDDAQTPGKHALSSSLEVPAEGYLLLYADEDLAKGPEHLNFRLSNDGGDVALYDPSGNGQVIHYGQVQDDFSIARTEDCCLTTGCIDWDFRGTPGKDNTGAEGETTTVFPAGSTWHYWDQGTSPSTQWMDPEYDASKWPTGPAPLGFGDDFQVTIISGGAHNARHTTTWFRASFELTDTAIEKGKIGLTVDDGARVFVNGTEALRVNLPNGPLTEETFALEAAADETEYTMYWYSFETDLLVSGENTLAVEVHQATSTSSDLNFDLSIRLTEP